MEKNMILRIFYFVLGFVAAIGITTVFAYSYLSEEVGYTPKEEDWNVDNVSDAIDDLYDKVKIENFTGNFYLSASIDGAGYSRTSYFDINVSKYKKITINIQELFYSNTSVFTSYVLADGVNVKNITARGSFDLDVYNINNIRIYYYENDGYYYLKGTYTLIV